MTPTPTPVPAANAGTSALEIAAYVLQLGGALVALYGVWETWHSYATSGEKFFAPVTELGRKIGQALGRWYRRVFRRPGRQVVGVGAAVNAEAALIVRAVKGYGPLPHAGDPTFGEEINRRINEAFRTAQDARHEVGDEREARVKADNELRTSLGQRMDGLEGMTRQVAIGGLRWESFGLFLVIVGTVLGFLAG